MDLGALLRSHEFMKVERPPELWEADTELERLVPLLGEMIASSLSRGGTLERLTLNASNVVVPHDDDPGHEGLGPPEGEFVALTVSGGVNWEGDATWLPGKPWRVPHLDDLTGRLVPAGACYAYIRRIPPRGSITVFLPRLR